MEETRKTMSQEVDNHNIENQKIREEFEGMLRSFDKLIEENRKKKQRIEELMVNKALLEKNIVDLEKEVAEDKEENKQKQGRIDKLSEEKRQLEMLTGVIPELKEQIQIVSKYSNYMFLYSPFFKHNLYFPYIFFIISHIFKHIFVHKFAQSPSNNIHHPIPPNPTQKNLTLAQRRHQRPREPKPNPRRQQQTQKGRRRQRARQQAQRNRLPPRRSPRQTKHHQRTQNPNPQKRL